MTQSDLKKIKDFYEKVILQGIILPLDINPIYQLIYPNETNPRGINYGLKQRVISVFMGTKYQQVYKELNAFMSDKPTSQSLLIESIDTIKNKDKQSHSEDDLKSQSKDDISGGQSSDLKLVHVSGIISKEQLEEMGNNLLSDDEQQEKLQQRIKELETEYVISNNKRSIAMQLNHLKKKLNKIKTK